MSDQKRRIFNLILFFFLTVGYSFPASAADPSNGLIIRVLNPPPGVYYLEVMTRQKAQPAPTGLPVIPYPSALSSATERFAAQGWIPFHDPTSGGTVLALRGEDFGGYREHRFYSADLAGEFTILTVSAEGEARLSAVLQKTMAEQLVDYDYGRGVIRASQEGLGYVMMFFSIFVPMFLLEMVLLAAFRIPYQGNGKVVLLMNLFSALLVTGAAGRLLVQEGRLAALWGGLWLLPVLILLETLVYFRGFSRASRGRILAYSVGANLVSQLFFLSTLFTSHRLFLAGF